MEHWINDNINRLQAYPANTILMVGIIRQGDRTIYNFGDLQNLHARNSRFNTIFEIGSVSKVFTSALLSLLVSNGLLGLDDPLCEFTPQPANLHPEITLLQLATHTSGLPKMPSNIIISMLKDRSNPYASYTTKDLLNYFSKARIKRRSEEQICYSNLGMGLLGYILETKLGMSYEQAVTSNICDPLDMPDTRITLSAEQAGRMAPPHTSHGRPGNLWDMPAFAGAGGLRSSPQDLLKFLEANMVEEDTAISKSLQNCHPIQSRKFSTQGQMKRLAANLLGVHEVSERYRQGIALGWVVGQLQSTDYQVYWHHGATGGYRSFVAFVKETAIGVAVLANSGPSMLDGFFGTTATDHLGLRILERIHASE